MLFYYYFKNIFFLIHCIKNIFEKKLKQILYLIRVLLDDKTH